MTHRRTIVYLVALAALGLLVPGASLNCTCPAAAPDDFPDGDDDDDDDSDVATDDDTDGDDDVDPFKVGGEVFIVPVYYAPDEDDIWHRAELERVLLDCLAKDRSDRPAGAGALKRALLGLDLGRDWTRERATAWWAARDPDRGAGGGSTSSA